MKDRLPTEKEALPGRDEPIDPGELHAVLNHPLRPPFPDHLREVRLGMGCFWGAERLFWQLPGVWTTAVGYAGGITRNPTYEEVCSGRTGHAEVVRVVYDPSEVSLESLLKCFWENHDPTSGMRQGNDIGTQYRSTIYVDTEDDRAVAEASRDRYQHALAQAGRGSITTEIRRDPAFYYAEAYHQQYLHKNPNGYCGLKFNGVMCPGS
ncbi:MAG: peptide-methionine (S)-S-oxide reductase MsrA [Gammaproteobacteria bacterium]|nr:MAG: peptide-methionine (S)-S-oxide reductase MsrA [Gammaproteobacteria bacterium]